MILADRLCFSSFFDNPVFVPAPNIDTIVSLAKRRGFVFPSSEVYGGFGGAWGYGPLGVGMCNNVKEAWWRWLGFESDDIEGVDSSIIFKRAVWHYSGHEATFHDPLIDCRECKTRLRADKIELPPGTDVDVSELIKNKRIMCPECGSTDLTEPRLFNMMLRTTLGAASAEDDPTALA